ncbi:MAG: hypothetical protein ACYS0I_19750 [Planctomycetota bacterium]|jgi:hypothetical protein
MWKLNKNIKGLWTMFDHRYGKIGTALPVMLVIVSLLTFGCSKEQFKEINPKSKGHDTLEVVGYGYVRMSPNARSNQKTLARQRARMLASKNLAAQISGIEFVYDKRKKQTVTFHKFQAHTRGRIKGAVTEYYSTGKSGILVKQTLKTKKAIPKSPQTTLLKTAFRTENMAKSLTHIYREAVAYTISRKFSSRKKATGKIYLANMQISDRKGPGPIKVIVELRITVK